jgi:hypothetical protein
MELAAILSVLLRAVPVAHSGTNCTAYWGDYVLNILRGSDWIPYFDFGALTFFLTLLLAIRIT